MNILVSMLSNLWYARTVCIPVPGLNRYEVQAAGLVPLVHASGGPLLNIVIEQDGLPTGFHATSPEDYSRQLSRILAMSPEEVLQVRKRARDHALRSFSEAAFMEGWLHGWQYLIAKIA